MGLLLKAGTAFAIAAYFLGIAPFAADSHWGTVKADLAAAHPRERLAAQAAALFRPGTPQPGADR